MNCRHYFTFGIILIQAYILFVCHLDPPEALLSILELMFYYKADTEDVKWERLA